MFLILHKSFLSQFKVLVPYIINMHHYVSDQQDTTHLLWLLKRKYPDAIISTVSKGDTKNVLVAKSRQSANRTNANISSVTY